MSAEECLEYEARKLVELLDGNVGLSKDWPIRIIVDDREIAEELTKRLGRVRFWVNR